MPFYKTLSIDTRARHRFEEEVEGSRAQSCDCMKGWVERECVGWKGEDHEKGFWK